MSKTGPYSKAHRNSLDKAIRRRGASRNKAAKKKATKKISQRKIMIITGNISCDFFKRTSLGKTQGNCVYGGTTT